MTELTVELHVKGEDGEFLTIPELEADPALLRRLAIDLQADPAGGLAITDDVEMILVDDSLTDAASFFLFELPDLLRAGTGGTYRSHAGPEETSVVVDGDTAYLTGYDDTTLSTSVTTLTDALVAAQEQYRALEQLVAGT
jgi:hypothetical protein